MPEQPIAVSRTISLYPAQEAVLQQVMKKYHLANLSAAIRHVIHDWVALKFGESEEIIAIPPKS